MLLAGAQEDPHGDMPKRHLFIPFRKLQEEGEHSLHTPYGETRRRMKHPGIPGETGWVLRKVTVAVPSPLLCVPT